MSHEIKIIFNTFLTFGSQRVGHHQKLKKDFVFFERCLAKNGIRFFAEEFDDGLMLLKTFLQQEISLDLHL